jgi:ribonucleoside-diphosphate reductase alpha chain
VDLEFPADAPSSGGQPVLGANALTVLERRYLERDLEGRVIETPDGMFRRVARAVAAVEGAAADEWAERFYQRMARLEFLPNSPTLMNAGRDLGQLAACFVVPVGDSMPQIFDAVKWASLIQMTGGGTGFSFSRLRPSGDVVASTRGVASGPMAFMDVFNSATDAVKQGGTRRGANMGVLRVDHPDILAFVEAKLDQRRLTNFNVSVTVTDAFMRAVKDDTDYALVYPRTGAEVGRLRAAAVWQRMAISAWRSGDPGVIFIDRVNELQPTPELGEIESTKPCGEQPLLPFESCVLGSIDLARFVAPAGDAPDWARLGACVRDSVRFLDDVIDVTRYPLPQIEAITKKNRKIGLGVMGFADLLIRLGVPYDAPRALELAAALGDFIERESLAASAELARTRGAFAAYAHSRWPGRGVPPLRNATTTTVAPTGTISIIAGCSSGIEPIYSIVYDRHVLDGTTLREVHPLFAATATARGFADEALWKALAARGRARGTAGVPEDVQRLYATAHDLPPEVHVRMQAVWQKHCHAAVSKTVNFPFEATPEDVMRVYQLAYDLGCKGVTVYRDRSRATQVLGAAGRPIAPEPATESEPPERVGSDP